MKVTRLEQERGRVLEILEGAASERIKLRYLVRFFSTARSEFPFEVLESYYLEFFSSFLTLVKEPNLYYSDLHYLSQVGGLVDIYQRHLADAVDQDLVSSMRDRVIWLRIAISLLLGEYERAVAELETGTSDHFPECDRNAILEILHAPGGSCSHIQDIEVLIEKNFPRSFQLLSGIRARLQDSIECQKPDKLYLLFVEKTEMNEVPDEDRGVLAPVRLRTSLRPPRSEEQLFRFDRDLVPQSGSLFRSLHEVIDAVRPILNDRYPDGAVRKYFQFEFFFGDKEAAYTGHSLEAGLGLLTAAGMVNAYFRRPIIRLDQGAVVTGGLDPKGDLVPVDNLGLQAKIKAAFYTPVKRIVVPSANLRSAAEALDFLRQKHPGRNLSLESAENLNQLFDDRNLVVRTQPTVPVRILTGIRHNQKKLAWAAAASLIALIGYQRLLDTVFRDRNPAQFEVEGKVLVVRNAGGDMLWEHDFGVELTDRWYGEDRLNAVVKDADHDGKNEVLIGIFENEHPEISGKIFCFGPDGMLRFLVRAGRKFLFNGETYADHYRIAFVDLQDVDADGREEVLSIAHQYPWCPCCINIWTLEGKKLGEYWHYGQMDRLTCLDLDQDREKEIVATGLSNAHRCAVLAVLSVPAMDSALFRIEGSEILPAGKEVYYLRFPRTEISRITGGRDLAYEVLEMEGGIQVAVGNGAASMDDHYSNLLYYCLGRDLRYRSVSISDNYDRFILQKTGRAPDPEILEQLNRIEYFDGVKWVSRAQKTENWGMK
jgi:hypothetical protein